MKQHFSYQRYEHSIGQFLPFSARQFEHELTLHYRGQCISGAQPKLTMQLALDHHSTESCDCIVKPSTRELPYLAENEFTTMTIMQELGFDVPNCWLANFIPERDSPIERAFVIKRFDRDNDGNPIHQEQLDAAMNATCKYGETDPNTEHSYISYERVYHFLKQHLVANPVLEDEFYKRVIAAYLLGNCDLHLRNFAIIYDDCGHMRLAPVYDYVAVSAYPFIMEPSMALPLRQFEEGNQNACPGFAQHGVYTGRDFIDFGCAIGLSEVTATHYIDDLFSHVPQIIEQYRCSLLPDHQIQSIEQWVNTVAYHFIEYR